MLQEQPNVVYVFADQWRAQDAGYAGNRQVRTPHLDRLAAQSINFTHAVAGIPVCCPARATLLTGQHALTHGVFVNDVHLAEGAVSMGKLFKAAGYDTAYVGKWHVDGRGRSNYIPPESRQGFDYWKALECTHSYNSSKYFAADSDQPSKWQGYDAIEQTKDVQAFIRNRKHAGEDAAPFLLVLSWGPPHAPYDTAPEAYRRLYDADAIELRPNVPPQLAEAAREWIAGYYAHCTALDDCLGALLQTLQEEGLAEDTLFVFTSDHGDMLGSQGEVKKQRPWEESIRVPFLLRWPRRFGWEGCKVDALLDTPDILPTLLSLCGIPIPGTVEGQDFAATIEGGSDPSGGAHLPMFPAFLEMAVDEVHVEMANREYAELELIGLIADKRDVAVGTIDFKSYFIETPQHVASAVRRCLEFAPATRLAFAPDCGLSQTARWAARQKLQHTVAGVRIVRGEE